jgi:hypothetical protein
MFEICKIGSEMDVCMNVEIYCFYTSDSLEMPGRGIG